ncbi:MAG: hypothetical protein WC814_00295 [Candidatus Paceibacterota bacterium]|jgi:hypothetical protein
MNYGNLTHEHLERGQPRELFTHLQNAAGLQEHGRARVDAALKAAIAHVEKKEDLKLGMKSHHIDMAMKFLDTHYEGRHDLKPKEREVIERSFKSHFGVTEPELETT